MAACLTSANCANESFRRTVGAAAGNLGAGFAAEECLLARRVSVFTVAEAKITALTLRGQRLDEITIENPLPELQSSVAIWSSNRRPASPPRPAELLLEHSQALTPLHNRFAKIVKQVAEWGEGA